MKRFLSVAILALLVILTRAQAQSVDDQYVGIYNQIQEADSLNSNGQPSQALAKYTQAQAALQKLQKIYPDWNPKVVGFRLNYVAAKIATLSDSVPASTTATNGRANPPPGTAANPAKPGPGPAPVALSDLEVQRNNLRDQVRQLQAERMVLEAKLKESLSAQPSAVDPRQMARAEEKINALQKETDLLKYTLSQERAKRVQMGDGKSPSQIQQALADTNRKLAEQTEKASTLSLEKAALQNRLNTLMPSSWNATALETTKKALEDTNRQLMEQKEINAKLTSEKEGLLARMKSANPESDAEALRTENQILKKELASLRAAPPMANKSADAARQLAAAQTQIAALQSDREILRLEKLALENRVKQLSTPGVGISSTAFASSKPEDASRVKQLERERDDLQKKLEAANKELFGRNGKAVAARIDEMQNQLTILRARLEVFEARSVPYTVEELALFKRPETTLASTDPKSGRKSVKELPAGSATLISEAQHYFSIKQLDKAEEKYQQVLKQDDKNVPTLANLAAIQLERNELDEAEKHIKQAIALAPEDAYSLSILGYLKFRQEKYDDALDALSRAAKLDPENAQIQNYLGITLSQKGMRGPAETALRKAIQIEPNYGSAHHNLAVIYVTQQPPLIELARWHYQKALAAGHARNADLEKMFNAQKTAAK